MPTGTPPPAQPTPAADEPTPATSGSESATNEAEPTTSGLQPTASGAEPTTSGLQPTASGAEPATSGPKSAPRGPTVVAEPTGMVLLVWLLSPVLGAALCWLVSSSAGWIASLRWMPMRGPFKLIDAVDEPWATGGALLLGALGGLLVAGIAAAERLTVTVAEDGVTLVRDDVRRRIGRDEITGAFRDGKRLVLLGPAAEELVRESSSLPADRLRAAFEAYGYRWYADGDPYRAEYRRWTDDGPELPPGANSLLKARQRALEKDDGTDLAELRTELARLGVVVREEGRRQYWRRAGQDEHRTPPPGS